MSEAPGSNTKARIARFLMIRSRSARSISPLSLLSASSGYTAMPHCSLPGRIPPAIDLGQKAAFFLWR